MRRVAFDPAQLTDPEQLKWWGAWQKKAANATEEAIAAWETWLSGDRQQPFKCKFKQTVWSELKSWLRQNVFYENCAYCETSFVRTAGDAEHYRPKGSVVTSKDSREHAQCNISLPPESPHGPMRHPGYFWLAYYWENLVPACEFCNSFDGKLDLYPVAGRHVFLKQLTVPEKAALKGPCWESPKWPGWYYLTSRDLDDLEKPLIINPLNATPEYDPSKHLRFGVAGIIAAADGSELGKLTINVYNLNTDKLREMRQKQQELAKLRYLASLQSAPDTEDPYAVAETSVKSFLEHKEPYSTAALWYLQRYRRKV